MRSTFILLLLSLAAGGALVMNARRHPASGETAKPTLVSQHDWAKQALDRTAELKTQVAQHRRESDDVK